MSIISEAMKIAIVEDGVIPVAFKRAKIDQIEIIGHQVDAAGMVELLRKKLGYADLVSVEEIPEKKVPHPQANNKKKIMTSQVVKNTYSYSPIRAEGGYYDHHYPREMEMHIYDPPSRGGCTIM